MSGGSDTTATLAGYALAAGIALAVLGQLNGWWCGDECRADAQVAREARLQVNQLPPRREARWADVTEDGPGPAVFRPVHQDERSQGRGMHRRPQQQVIVRQRQEFDEGQDYCNERAHGLPFR
ncbi:MAG: hypothetical protein RLZZ342_88, partial [Candidatus Parcubacteria bacterium]